jgi:hypothetical protein
VKWVVLFLVAVLAIAVLPRAIERALGYAAAPVEQPAAPQVPGAASYVLRHARRYDLTPSRRLTVPISYSDGAWYLYDKRRLEVFRAGEPWLLAIADLDKRRGAVGLSGGVAAVGWCGEGEAEPSRWRLRARPAGRVDPGYDTASEFDLDFPSGQAVIQPNGDGAAEAVVHLPAGRYRVRLSLDRTGNCNRLRYAVELWPRRRAVPPAIPPLPFA